MMKFGRIVFRLREQTDRQTYSSKYFAPLLGGEVKNNIRFTPYSTVGVVLISMKLLYSEPG